MDDTLLSRFLRYVQIDTQADETSSTLPSTAHNAHGPLEWVAVQEMELAVKACAKLAELWAA